ncbi:hypothetical protein [Marivirga sp.]|uniref:hypothetical protein n=1 Tax=Marivirga sp. TaxID=2018662 RepID=UPI002D80BB25|nr:hypothetical protein [Marivirga sp.]HET8859852.1 hypothetical protein [Marivirga sp.]
MRQFKTGLIASIISIIFISSSFSQQMISPYSAYGLGLMSEKGFVSNNGMGNAGIAYQSPWFIPALNPALLGSQRFTSFEAGLSLNQNNINDDVTRYRQINGGLKYVGIAFPIIAGKYAISFTLRPLTTKNYDILRKSSDRLNDPQAEETKFSGEGTISQFSFANGWNITKNIAVGAEVNYNFGTLTDRTVYQNIINGADTIFLPYLVSTEFSDQYSDFSFTLGTKFMKQIGKNFLSVGATYDLQSNLKTSRNSYLQLLSTAETPLRPETDEDLFLDNDSAGITVLPQKISFGISYMKPNSWAILADVSYQDWSQYSSFGVSENSFQEQIKLNFGGEFTPNVESGSKYIERITYRAGLNISNGPLVINGNSINSFGITFGSTLPINKISNINLAFEVGQRGTLLDNLVQENYLNFNLSFTFNDRWFLRRQFD